MTLPLLVPGISLQGIWTSQPPYPLLGLIIAILGYRLGHQYATNRRAAQIKKKELSKGYIRFWVLTSIVFVVGGLLMVTVGSGADIRDGIIMIGCASAIAGFYEAFGER
ncbi:MAG: hypothetical protein AAGG02_18920 [Cyanobacteria bacterium P01_H01_bin.15]